MAIISVLEGTFGNVSIGDNGKIVFDLIPINNDRAKKKMEREKKLRATA